MLQRTFIEPALEPDQRIIKTEDPSVIPYVPFQLSNVNVADVLIQHYLLGKKYYEIDKGLLDNPDTYDPFYLDAIKAGRITFEIVPQRYRRTSKDLARVEAENHVRRLAERQLVAAGFKRTGVATVEFRNTQWETVAFNFENRNRSVRLLFRRDLPPLGIYRERTNGQVDDIFYKSYEEHPISHLYEEQMMVDDRTRKQMKAKLFVPNSYLNIPELPELEPVRQPIIVNFRKEYADSIRQNLRGDASRLLQRLGLGLF